jgi:hypothetical protein
MSEQYPLSREEFLTLTSHTPSSECRTLCRDRDRLVEQWSSAEIEAQKARSPERASENSTKEFSPR